MTSLNLTATLTKEKEKDYVRLLILLLAFITYTLLIVPTLEMFRFGFTDAVLQTGALAMGTLLVYLIFLMIKNFIRNKVVLALLFILMIFGIVMGSVANNPFFPLDPQSVPYKISLASSFGGALVGMAVCLYFMIVDIFAEVHTINYRLWGAAVIYLMIMVFFTDLTGFLQVFFQDGLGVEMRADVHSYIACFKFCFYALSGIDLPYPDASDIFKNIVAIQGLMANLFIVLLVGRILSK